MTHSPPPPQTEQLSPRTPGHECPKIFGIRQLGSDLDTWFLGPEKKGVKLSSLRGRCKSSCANMKPCSETPVLSQNLKTWRVGFVRACSLRPTKP